MLVSEMLTKETIQRFSKRSDWSALRVVLGNWLMIASIFAAVALWTNPAVVILVLVLPSGVEKRPAALSS